MDSTARWIRRAVAALCGFCRERERTSRGTPAPGATTPVFGYGDGGALRGGSLRGGDGARTRDDGGLRAGERGVRAHGRALHGLVIQSSRADADGVLRAFFGGDS